MSNEPECVIPTAELNHESTDPVAHLGLAEQGKIHAVAGEHTLALVYYRHAMRIAVESEAPEAFFRHYLECTVESLELLGFYEEVIDYCVRAENHYKSVTAVDSQQAEFIARDQIAIAQRRGLVLVKLNRLEEACEWLDSSQKQASAHGIELPLASVVLGWLKRGLYIDAQRLLAEQKSVCYFAVTENSINRSIAFKLPPSLLVTGGL